jgi:hypothetical protein
MKTQDQQLLEEAYQEIVRQSSGFGTKLRPNYSFSQIDKDSWRGDSRFEGLDLKFPDKESWEGTLKFDGKTIDLVSKGQEVFVDGKELSPEEKLNLRNYIISRYATTKDTSNKFTGPVAFSGKGEPVKK